MERRGRSRLVQKKDAGRQRVDMVTLKRIRGLRLISAKMFEDEIVPIAVACWDGTNRLEIFDPLEARRQACRAITCMP
jgi:hypothetical protein